jgi:FemAB-related protein (PEP-CTERM system-associated)
MLMAIGSMMSNLSINQYKILSTGQGVPGQEEITEEEWHLFIRNCPEATVYHLPEWSRILEKSLGCKPLNLFARDQEGHLCGILPLSLIKSPLTGSHLVSLPFSYICGPLSASNSAAAVLIEEAKRLSQALKCDYLEIRTIAHQTQGDASSIYQQNGFEINEEFSTYVLELGKPEEVWTKLDPKSVRWAIRKAQKDGVTVRKANSVSDIKCFYNLNLKTKTRLGVPGHPQKLFLEMLEELGAQCQLYLAEFQNRIIAGIVTLRCNSIVLYGYGASEANYLSHQPNDLLIWTAIEESCRDGYQFFDFGRVSTAEQGLAMFKKHWGTKVKSLAYYYYPHVPKSMALNPHGMKYRLMTSIWKKIPLPLARVGSNIIFKHLG